MISGISNITKNSNKYSDIINLLLIFILFIIIVISQLSLPYFGKLLTNLIINSLHNSPTISLSPTEINDIYITIIYTIIIALFITILVSIQLLTPIYKKDSESIVHKAVNFLFYEKNYDITTGIFKSNPFSSVMMNYFTFAFLFIIIVYIIQLYRYIDNLLIKNSNGGYKSILSSYSYGYNKDIYAQDLITNKFLKEKLLDIGDYNSLLFILLGLFLLIFPIIKLIWPNLKNIYNIELISDNSELYWLILICGLLIYLCLLIKSIIIIYK
jgi:magnesium-transporting ATPase (P-type)